MTQDQGLVVQFLCFFIFLIKTVGGKVRIYKFDTFIGGTK